MYDVATNTWSLGTARDPERAFNMAAALADGIHVVGGFNTQRLDIHDLYDPVGGSWSSRAPLLIAVHARVADAVNGKLYVSTGVNGAQIGPQIYDPATDSWSFGTPRPVPAAQSASAVIDGKIYVAGGQVFASSDLDDLDRYDPLTDSWETLQPMPGPRSSIGGGAIGGQFCVFGGRLVTGSPTGGRFSETFCYDPTTDTWTQGPDMITRRAEMASTELGNAIYAFGGRPMNDALQGDAAERLVPDTPF